jgi:hypothetical protein
MRSWNRNGLYHASILTFSSRIASEKMLLCKVTLAQKECYPRADFGSAEGAYDESTQQAGND